MSVGTSGIRVPLATASHLRVNSTIARAAKDKHVIKRGLTVLASSVANMPPGHIGDVGEASRWQVAGSG